MKMKKYIAALLASAMTISNLAGTAASAESYGDNTNIVVLGDSISSGEGLAPGEYTYAQIIGDYLGGNVENYAVTGYESQEVLAQIRSFDSTQKAKLAEADVVVISIGGNDMVSYAISSLLEFAVNIDVIAEGKTAADFPEKLSFATLSEFLDKEKLKAYISNLSGMLLFNDKLDSIYNNITYTDDNNNADAYDQVIAKKIIPNIEAIRDEIKKVNPDAKIVLQTLYNPLQLDAQYEKNLKASVSSSYFSAYIKFKTIFQNTTKRYAEMLKEVEGVELADVYTDFSSTDENRQSYGWYFTKIQSGLDNMDIHPTQAGHTAIAVSVLNALGETRKDGGLLDLTFKKLPNSANYPAYALEQYKKVAGSYCLGDTNNDGYINSADASIVLEQYALLSTGKQASISADMLEAGKVNSDDVLDSSDASLILGYYAFTSVGGKGSLKNYIAEQ